MPKSNFNPKPIVDMQAEEQAKRQKEQEQYAELRKREKVYEDIADRVVFEAFRVDSKDGNIPNVSLSEGDGDLTPLFNAICLATLELRRIANALEKRNKL